MKSLTPPPRVVKPRKPVRVRMPIVVWDGQSAYFERDSNPVKWDIVELVHYLRENWPLGAGNRRRALPILLATLNPHALLLRIHPAFKDDPEWQVRLNVSEDDREPSVRVFSQDNLHVRIFGFRTEHRNTRYFHPVSPLDFMQDFRSYGDPKWPEWLRLYQWALELRKWIWDNKMRFSPTKGGLAAQLLRDGRFYPNARRKVPTIINEDTRKALPGNFYASAYHGKPKLYGSVFVIDQQNAHHFAAETVQLPSSNRLEARGRHRSLNGEVFAAPGSETFNTLTSEYGLLELRIFVPKGLLGSLPPWAMEGGLQTAYVFTNELEMLHKLGVEIRHISCAWTSPNLDTGLAKYAQWSQAEIETNPKAKQWLKPTLLSAYGILGVRPRTIESAFWRTDKGTYESYGFGPHVMRFKQIKTVKAFQSPIANVIHRGMIEAETRRLSIELARQLEDEGHSVIAIHADAVIIDDEGQQLPLLPPPWRVKHKLSRFKVIDKVSFESDALTILPGRKRGR